MLAPIALFAFNRRGLLERTLDALAANELAKSSALTLFCDGPRNQAEKEKTDLVREVAWKESSQKRFSSVTVIERSENLGCANAVIHGLEEMFANHERVIVIEDDVLCSPYTLAFLNRALDKYVSCKAVWNIAAWSPPPSIFPFPADYPFDVYAIPRFNGWGWAMWRDRFALVDWAVDDYAEFASSPHLQKGFNSGGDDMTPMLQDQMLGRIDAWDIRMDYARFKYGGVGINPVRSYTTNIGIGSGTHTTEFNTRWDNNISLARDIQRDFRWLEHIFMDEEVGKRYRKALAPKNFKAWAKGWLKTIKRGIASAQ